MPRRTKRRSPGEGSIRQRPDGRWEVRVVAGGHARSFYANSHAEALKLLTEKAPAARKGMLAQRATSLATWLDEWLARGKPEWAPNTYRNYERAVRLRLKPDLGAIPVDDLRRSAITSARRTWRDRGDGLHAINHAVVTLRNALGEAAREELVSFNAAEKVQPLKAAARAPVMLEESDLQRLFEAADAEGLQWGALYRVAALGGLRWGEATGLRWSDVGFDTGTARIETQIREGADGKLERGPVKSAHSRRTVYLGRPVIESLERLAGSRADASDGLIFRNAIGGPLRRQDHLRREWARITKASDLEGLVFHDLRHAAASLMAAQGVGLSTARDLLGHASIRTTGDIYTRTSNRMMRDAAARIADPFHRVGSHTG